MKRATKTVATAAIALHAQKVGASELRGNLAKYLKLVKAGTTVIIQERGRNAYVLLPFEAKPEQTAFGCMRGRTEYVNGAVLNAREAWSTGDMP